MVFLTTIVLVFDVSSTFTSSITTSSNKRYLVGSSSSTSVATENTNTSCYMQSGYLYSNDKQVLPVSAVNPSSTTSTLTGLTINGTSYAVGGSGGLPTVPANTTISNLKSQYPNQWVNVFGTTSSALQGANGQVYLQVSGTTYKLNGILKVGTNLMNASNITVSNTSDTIMSVFTNYAFKYATLYSTKIELEDRDGYTYYLFYNSTKPQANIPTSSVSDLLQYVFNHINQYSRDESISPLYIVYQLQSGQWYSSPASITLISNSYRIRCFNGTSSSATVEEIQEDDLDSVVSVKTGAMVNG